MPAQVTIKYSHHDERGFIYVASLPDDGELKYVPHVEIIKDGDNSLAKAEDMNNRAVGRIVRSPWMDRVFARFGSVHFTFKLK